MTSSSFTRLARLTVSTKRPPDVVGGRRGAPVTHLTGVPCLPLDPVDAELRARFNLPALGELLQTMVQGGLDIREGDLLVSGQDYPIRAVANWHWTPDNATYLLLILDQPSSGKWNCPT